MEAATGFEPVIKVLQTLALPLGYRARLKALYSRYRATCLGVNLDRRFGLGANHPLPFEIIVKAVRFRLMIAS